jgi:hypothetical protein
VGRGAYTVAGKPVPFHSPVKYWAAEPFVARTAPVLRVRTHFTLSSSPSTGKGKKSGYSHTPGVAQSP